MRGGAIPVLAWAAILTVLYAGDWVWEGKPMQMGTTAYAVGAVLLVAGLLILANRQAARRGEPPRPETGEDLEGVPDVSFAPVGIAFGVACFAFGFAFGHFAIYFGAGVLVLSLGRLAQERRSQRRTLAEVAARREASGGR